MIGPNSFPAARLLEGAILVIDDDLTIRKGLTDIFAFIREAPVYTAATGYNGLRILEQQQGICQVLLDINMPLMSGEETYKKLR
jgi:CheY-like chemotaxis protein